MAELRAFLDGGDAAREGWSWLQEQISPELRAGFPNNGAKVQNYQCGGDNHMSVLWHGLRPLAAFTVLRDDMNRSKLLLWKEAADAPAMEVLQELWAAHNEVASYRVTDGHDEYVRRRDRNIDAWQRVRDIATAAKPPIRPPPHVSWAHEVEGPWRLELNGVTISRHDTEDGLETAREALLRALAVSTPP